MLVRPAEVVGPDSGELVRGAEAGDLDVEGEEGVEDAEVEVVARVGPDGDEEDEVGGC